MEPSKTERGQRWLSNFDAEDRAVASFLLDSIEFVGQDTLRTSLTELIQQLAEKLPTPIALVPARELAPGQTYYGKDRNARPRLLLSASFPGSEAIIANIATGLRRQRESAGPFVAAPSLKNLRDARCRSILFLDDFAGSGKRLLNFRKEFRLNPSILSWESYGLIEYHCVTYAGTRAAHHQLSKAYGEDRVHFVKFAPTLDNRGWALEEKSAARGLCLRYADGRAGTLPLGYEESAALIAFSHTAPNNLPAIFCQKYGPFALKWHSFFQKKAVPSDLSPLFLAGDREGQTREGMRRVGQRRLADYEWEFTPAPSLQEKLLVLAGIAKRPRNMNVLAELVGLEILRVQGVVEHLRRSALIAAKTLHLTDSGRAELGHAKGVLLPSSSRLLKGSSKPYYPSALRVGR